MKYCCMIISVSFLILCGCSTVSDYELDLTQKQFKSMTCFAKSKDNRSKSFECLREIFNNCLPDKIAGITTCNVNELKKKMYMFQVLHLLKSPDYVENEHGLICFLYYLGKDKLDGEEYECWLYVYFCKDIFVGYYVQADYPEERDIEQRVKYLPQIMSTPVKANSK